jgi:hypothetical protein
MITTIKELIIIALLIGSILLPNISVGAEFNGHELYLKDNFHISIRPYNYGNYLLCEVQLWSSKNKEPLPSNRKDGDIDIAYIYRPAHNPFEYRIGAHWLKVVNKWEKSYNGQLRSNSKTGTYFYKIPYSQVPGKPMGFPLTKTIEFNVDFDENEEFAKGVFFNKESALEWAERMIKILNGNSE